jgi:hypothetical protein
MPRPIPAATSQCCKVAIESIFMSRAEGRRGRRLFHVKPEFSEGGGCDNSTVALGVRLPTLI